MIKLKNGSVFADFEHLNEFVKIKACSACKHLGETSYESVCIPCIMDTDEKSNGSNFEQSEIKEENKE